MGSAGRVCAEECEQHAAHQEHCRLCEDARQGLLRVLS